MAAYPVAWHEAGAAALETAIIAGRVKLPRYVRPT
jgi:hypothetical protein